MSTFYKYAMSLCAMCAAVVMVGCGKDNTKPTPKPNNDKVTFEVENLEYIKLAESMGVDAVINKKLITAGRIFKFTLSSKVRFVKYMSGTKAEVLEYIVSPGSAITKTTLMNMNFPSNAIIGGIIRGNESFIAVGDTQIMAYDRVAVFALPDAVKEVDKFFK